MLFIQDTLQPNIGIGYISGFLKRNGVDTRLLLKNRKKNVVSEIKEIAPDLIGIPCMTGNENKVVELSNQIKNSSIASKIIVGGPHPTFFPSGFQGHASIDYICRGECDNNEIMDLLSHIKNGGSSKWEGNNILENNGSSQYPHFNITEDLDSLPFPDMDMYYDNKLFKGFHSFLFITSRGCPYKCSYCHNSTYNKLVVQKKYLRRHSPEYVVEYLVMMKKKYGNRFVRFFDDIFVRDKEWIEVFVELYNKKVNLPYFCHLKPDLFDEDYARLLKESKCYSVCFGIETGNEKLRERVLNRKSSNDSIYKTSDLLHKYGIKFATNNIVGLPDESLGDSFETIKLNYEIKSTAAWCSIYTPYPSTLLSEYCLEKGYVDRRRLREIEPFYFKRSILKTKDINKQVNLHKFFYICSKSKSSWPLVKTLINLKYNKLFECIFATTFLFFRKVIHRQSYIKTIKEILFQL